MKKKGKKETTTTGLEPVRGDPTTFRVSRLNHSAKLPIVPQTASEATYRYSYSAI